MAQDPQPRRTGTSFDWGGFALRLAAWLLVFACVFAIFYGLTAQPTARRPAQPAPLPGGETHPLRPAPAGSEPVPADDPLHRFSV